MSPLRKHPIETPGKRDKGRRRKGKIGEGSSYLSPATQLGALWLTVPLERVPWIQLLPLRSIFPTLLTAPDV